MGRDLRREIVQSFKEKMAEHSKVAHIKDVSDCYNILFHIVRAEELSELTVQLSDAYCYTMQSI